MNLNPETKLKDDEPNAFFLIEDDTYTGYYELIITDYKENHSEGVNVINPLTDSNFSFTTGANPVSVTFTGYVIIAKEYNQRDMLAKKYEEDLRGTRGKTVRFVYKDMVYKLKIHSLNMTHNSTMQDMVPINIEGIGYSYAV